MLATHELSRLCERLGLSAEARAIIDSIRSSPPARRVRSAAGNVSVRYPSRKMGVTIQAESHHVELTALYEYEHDAQTLEFYDQPLSTYNPNIPGLIQPYLAAPTLCSATTPGLSSVGAPLAGSLVTTAINCGLRARSQTPTANEPRASHAASRPLAPALRHAR